MKTSGLGLDRRSLVLGSAGLASLSLGGCATEGALSPSAAATSLAPPRLAPLRADMNRVFDITVCTRPFRAAGPRLEAETVGDALVVHNYGHGGSGWSLSWGSGALAVRIAIANAPKEIAVVGCGAIGLTSAILAQEAGAKVTIYARDLLPDVRSSRATGSWTPDSRIALTKAAGPAFGDRWEEMARISYKRYRRYLGLPGTPVEWTDRYTVFDEPPGSAPEPEDPLGFAKYEDRIRDIVPHVETLPAGSTPFPTPYVRRNSSMQFNVADYGHTLMTDFLTAGGRIERREFHSLSELGGLKEKVVINCPGYAARALCKDESITPVRGQITWLIPQPEVTYGVYYDGVSMLSRRDGIVIQAVWGGDMFGYGDDHETVDHAEAEKAVGIMAGLYARMKG
jgi:glycine/D-amino acid oxidase-like deaminating enzyme